MKLAVEELGATKRRLKVEIPGEDINAALDKAYKDLQKTAKVDGFRPGHTPRGILEKKYAENVQADVMEKIVPQYYFKAVEEAKIFPVDNPDFEEKELKLRPGQPLSFTATVEVRPDFELATYKGIPIKEEPLEVTDEEMAEAMEEMRDVHSTLESVEEDRPAAKDDFVVIDFEGFIDGKPFDGGKAENYTLGLGSGRFIEGFEEQLTGMKKGADVLVNVRFPDDYKSKELAGKDTEFKVKLKEIKKKVLPEPDDEFAKDLRMGETLAEMKEKLKEELLSYKRRGLAGRQKDLIIKELIKANQLELPPSMVEKELRALIIRRHQERLQALQSGQAGDSQADKGFDIKEYEAEARPKAEERVKVTLILAAIADKEDIRVSEAEVEAGIRRLASETGYSPTAIKELYQKRDGSLEGLRGIIGEDKVLEFLLKEAKKD